MPIPSEKAFERIGRAVKVVEGWMPGLAAEHGPARQRDVEVTFVRVTSGTADGNGNYPAVITLRSGSDGSWADYSACKLRPLNGETLTSGTRYPAKAVGVNGSDEVYQRADTASGGSTSVTVQGAAGTPSHTGKDTLRFIAGAGSNVTFSLAESGTREDVTVAAPNLVRHSGNAMHDFSFTGAPATLQMNSDAGGAGTVTGIVSDVTTASKTRLLVFANEGTTASITIKHQDATSSAANRIITPGGVDYVLGVGRGCLMIYDTAASRWRIIDK